MWRKTASVAGGLLVACAAAYFVQPTGSAAQPVSFDARWLAFSPAQKADRIDGPKQALEGRMHFFALPTLQTTVVVRDMRKLAPDVPAARDRSDETSSGSAGKGPARILPRDITRKDKLPVGCEPSFSPVTTPNMANVSGRCLS